MLCEERELASLVEELVNILEAEEKIYQILIGYGERKRDVLIAADVPALEEITALEQLKSDNPNMEGQQKKEYIKNLILLLRHNIDPLNLMIRTHIQESLSEESKIKEIEAFLIEISN